MAQAAKYKPFDEKTYPHHIGNYSEKWRTVVEQAIAEFGPGLFIGLATHGCSFGLYVERGAGDLGEFHNRKRKLAQEQGLIK